MLLDGHFIKIGRNQYVPQEPIDVEAYKQMHAQRKKERIRQSNIAYAKSMTQEERQQMNEKLSKAQKDRLLIPENLEKHRERQKRVMSTELARQHVSEGSKRRWESTSDEYKKSWSDKMSTAVTLSWTNPITRVNRIRGSKKAYEERGEDIMHKIHETKKRNSSFTKSRPAEYCIQLLRDAGFTVELEKHYPETHRLHCDAYVLELDLWIEFHFFWTHGKEPFDASNEEHVKLLELYKARNTKQYNAAVFTWSELDVRKRETAQKHGLNYRCFYNVDSFIEFFNRIQQKDNN